MPSSPLYLARAELWFDIWAVEERFEKFDDKRLVFYEIYLYVSFSTILFAPPLILC